MTWLTKAEIKKLRFAKVGKDVFLSNRSTYYNCSKIRIGDYVRIDDFCVLSAGKGGIFIGRNVHIGAHTCLVGNKKNILDDFPGLSSKISIHSGDAASIDIETTSPLEEQDLDFDGEVRIGKHAGSGCGSVILSGSNLQEGAAVGAMSLVFKRIESFSICFGRPAKRIAIRKYDFINLEKAFLKKY